jgi:hypothetical protein
MRQSREKWSFRENSGLRMAGFCKKAFTFSYLEPSDLIET